MATLAAKTSVPPAQDESRDRGGSNRLASIDLLRGTVMIVMLLDHTRDFFTDSGLSPTNLATTTPALFFTRWITHFCAPVFVFLAGTGAFLWRYQGQPKTRGQLALFLLTRGLWLIVLEETWVNLCFHFALPKVVMAVILWAIGWSMIALAGLIFLPRALVGAVGIGMIALHNLLDPIQLEGAGATSVLWHFLHQPGLVPLPGGFLFMVGYPVVPWIGVMAAGYVFGSLYLLPRERRTRVLIGLGLALCVVFVALRASNAYGDPQPWSPQASSILTVISFLNCLKYPPSLLFLLMTLGPAMVALACLERGAGRLSATLMTFGRVPLFFYLLQWPLLHTTALAGAALSGQPTVWLFGFPPFQNPPGYGVGLPAVYLLTLFFLAILYWPCRWFADLKRRRRDAWLSYL
jgi:uncharacterized membrane protein